MGKLKVIVLSGFLGSGKTTFIKNVIQYSQDLKISIILNDISQFDMDIDLIKNKSIQFRKTNDMIQMGGGCVCCTLKDEMIKEVKKIHKSKKYEYLFIEATGISTPLPVAQAFHASDSIMKIATIYSMITVIDAENFLINLTSDQIIEQEKKSNKRPRKNLRKRKGHSHQHQHQHQPLQQELQPTLSQLMLDQLEITNLIVLNKIDLVSKQQLQRVIAYIKSINPETQIVPTTFSKVDLKNLLSVKIFDIQKAEQDAKWIMQKEKLQDIPQTIKYNISSFVYEARRPFEPNKFFGLINHKKNYEFWNLITRAKGFFWLANYPRYSFTLQKAGARIYYQMDQPWYCEISKQYWGQTAQEKQQFEKFIKRFWDQNTKDKRIQLVFISQDLKKEQITKKLNSCLIKEDQFEKYEQIYGSIQDPFKQRWKQGQKFFQEQGILLQNDGDWEQVDQQSEQEQKAKKPVKKIKSR